MRSLTKSEQDSVNYVANQIKANPQDLIKLINFESGLNPLASNKLSSAKGLIQFIDSTAKKLGYQNSQDLINRHPTFESQMLGPVLKYLKPLAPYPALSDLAMAVFMPYAKNFPANTSFTVIYKKLYGENWLKNYTNFEKQNPGIKSIQDYVNKVEKKNGTNISTSTKKKESGVLTSILLAVNAVIYYFVFKK